MPLHASDPRAYVGEPHQDVEAPVALEERADLVATDGEWKRSGTSSDVQPVARKRLAVDVDGQHRQAGACSTFDFGRAADGAHDRDRPCLARTEQHIEIVAEDLDADVAANAPDQFVERIWIGWVMP